MANLSWHESCDALRRRLEEALLPFVTVLAHGSMSVELFTPRGCDNQQLHAQDELYIINRGSASFARGAERIECQAGDVLFVPAGMAHRFESFGDDFESWVVFWGPPGDEAEPKDAS